MDESDKLHTERFKDLVDKAKRRGVSREMIGEQCQMSASGVTQYYTGNRTIGFDAALKFSQYFRVPTEYLYTKVGEIVTTQEMDRFRELLDAVPESEHPYVEMFLKGLSK